MSEIRHKPSEPGKTSFGAGAEADRLRNLVERLRAENENLRECQSASENERERELERYEFAPLALLTLSHHGTVERANWAAALLLGEEPRRLLRKQLRLFVERDDWPLLTTHLHKCRSSASPVVSELHLRVNGADPLLVELRTTRSSDHHDLVQGALIDLRERELMHRENQRLTEAERVAREATAARDQFIAMLSHELRTPLTPVLALASALRERPDLAPELTQVFEMIQRNVSAEARLIDDLLDVTSITRGKLSVIRDTVDVGEIVERAIELSTDAARARRQNITTAFSALERHTRGDALRLTQVFSNLLRNAVKFTAEGGDIQVSTWNTGARIAVEIADSGIGFDPAEAERLFEAFHQAGQRHVPGGLGLGLAISKGLVELHGGTIVASSRGLGLGSRFVVELRVHPEELRAKPATEAPKRGTMHPAAVLLVEDHPDTVDVITRLLESNGYTVVPATSVQTAKRIDLLAIDIIVSDLGLPDGSGLDLVQQLHREKRCPAIALSGYGTQCDVQNCREAGFDVHLTKPVDINELLTTIQRLVKNIQNDVQARPND